MFYLDSARWLTIIQVPSSIIPSRSRFVTKITSIFLSKKREEIACHLNVSAADFLFCIFDRFGFFIFVKGASEGGDRVLTAGKVVKIYEDSFRGKWDDDDHDGDCHGNNDNISAQSLKAYYPEHNKLRRRQLKTAIKVVLKGGGGDEMV